MSDNSDDSDSGLGWLSGDNLAKGGNKNAAGGDKNAKGGDKNPKKADLGDDVLDWLSGGDAGDTMMSPDGAAQAIGNALGDAFGWGDEPVTGDSIAVPGDKTMVSRKPVEETAGETSIFSSAVDEIFKGFDDSPIDDSMANTADLSASTARRVRDNKIDRIVGNMLKYLTRRDSINGDQLGPILESTISKVVDAVKAEVIAVFFLNKDKLVVSNVFYSRNLFRREAEALNAFQKRIERLNTEAFDKTKGIIGKCIAEKRLMISHNVPTDPDYVPTIAHGTAFEVKTMLTLPILDGEEVFGAFQVMNKDEVSGEMFFSTADTKLLEELASYTGRLVHRIADPDIVPDDAEMARYIARLSKCELFDVTKEDYEWDHSLFDEVGEANISKWLIIPLKRLKGKRLKAVMINPLEFQRRAGFEAVSGFTIEEAVVGVKKDMEAFIEHTFAKKKSAVGQSDIEDIVSNIDDSITQEVVDVVDEDENSGPMIKLANRIIEGAYERGASDIHIEPFENETRVRYRVDGVLHEVFKLPQKTINTLASRIKIMSSLDISERRIPQDGKIKFKKWSKKGLDFDLRVATGPMAFGEKICMRLLVKGNISLGLDAMGFSPENMALYRWAVAQPYGMILNVGPTGSGKTTTLYSALTEVSTPDVNVHTAEDPIEYPLHGINQMQMQKDIGLTFATALKCFLRMDPDIILVGEIRDLETGEIGIEAALTGHLLFSTLHTNDAAGTVTRFIEMGIEPFMISSSLLLVCAQRLGRRLCKFCKEPFTPTADEMGYLNRDTRALKDMFKKKPKGCPKCGGSGTKGRVGIHEILTLNEELRELINRSASSDELKAAARRNGMFTMFQDGLWKVKEGLCDLEEIVGGIKADEDVAR